MELEPDAQFYFLRHFIKNGAFNKFRKLGDRDARDYERKFQRFPPNFLKTPRCLGGNDQSNDNKPVGYIITRSK